MSTSFVTLVTLSEAIRSYRGYLQKQQQKIVRERQRRVEPKDVIDYPILGRNQSHETELPLIEGDPILQRLGLKVFTQLAYYCDLILRPYQHPEKKRTLSIGMSGGADSTLVLCLAHYLRENLEYSVKAIHCIHGLDPDDDIWLEHNQKLCQRLDIELITPRLNIVYGNGVSPEEISRKERYRALLENTSKETDCLVLGHQADDQIENFLLALKRGSGPNGLSGMSMVTKDERGILLRPLLLLHKHEIEQLLHDFNVSYVYDLSNSYMKFERNYMRLKVMPLLRQRFPGIDRSILRSQHLCAIEHDLAERYASMVLEKCKGESTEFEHELYFNDLDIGDENLMIMLLRAFFHSAGVEAVDSIVLYRVWELLNKVTFIDPSLNGVVEVPGTFWRVSMFQDKLILYKALDDYTLSLLKGQYSMESGSLLALGAVQYVFKRSYAYTKIILNFDYSTSERMQPMGGSPCSKTFKTLFAEHDIAPWKRKIYPKVLSSEGKVLSLGMIESRDVLSGQFNLEIRRVG